MMEITINVPGITELAEAIKGLAAAMGGNTAAPTQNIAPAQPVAMQTMAAPIAQPNMAAPAAQMTPAGVATPVPQATVPTSAPVQPAVPQTPAAQQIPTTAVAQGYTQDQLAVAATCLVDQGKQPVLMQILAAFGAQTLMQVPKERYGELATELRKAGASI